MLTSVYNLLQALQYYLLFQGTLSSIRNKVTGIILFSEQNEGGRLLRLSASERPATTKK